MTTVEDFAKDLETDIRDAYLTTPTLEEAEKLAIKMLYTQVEVGTQLRTADLDFRMKRSGLKTIKAAVYLEECRKADKKPTESTLEALVNTSPLVTDAQHSADYAEALKNQLENTLNVAREAHIFFRGLAKGRFDG